MIRYKIICIFREYKNLPTASIRNHSNLELETNTNPALESSSNAGLVAVIVTLLMNFIIVPVFAGTQEDQLIRSVVKQVESISLESKTLESAGKKSLTQSAVVLDMGEASLPVLMRTLHNRKKNWKLRYWVTDLLGYVGNSKIISSLLGIIGDSSEVMQIRLRACDSLQLVVQRERIEKEKILDRLYQISEAEGNEKLEEKIRTTLTKLREGNR